MKGPPLRLATEDITDHGGTICDCVISHSKPSMNEILWDVTKMFIIVFKHSLNDRLIYASNLFHSMKVMPLVALSVVFIMIGSLFIIFHKRGIFEMCLFSLAISIFIFTILIFFAFCYISERHTD